MRSHPNYTNPGDDPEPPSAGGPLAHRVGSGPVHLDSLPTRRTPYGRAEVRITLETKGAYRNMILRLWEQQYDDGPWSVRGSFVVRTNELDRVAQACLEGLRVVEAETPPRTASARERLLGAGAADDHRDRRGPKARDGYQRHRSY